MGIDETAGLELQPVPVGRCGKRGGKLAAQKTRGVGGLPEGALEELVVGMMQGLVRHNPQGRAWGGLRQAKSAPPPRALRLCV